MRGLVRDEFEAMCFATGSSQPRSNSWSSGVASRARSRLRAFADAPVPEEPSFYGEFVELVSFLDGTSILTRQ